MDHFEHLFVCPHFRSSLSNESRHTCEWVMSPIWWVSHKIGTSWLFWTPFCLPLFSSQICRTSLVTHMNESRLTHEWAVSHMWMRRVEYIRDPCHKYEWVMSHICMSYVTRMNESYLSGVPCMNESWRVSCHIYERVMSFIWMSHGTHIDESWHTWANRVSDAKESCHTREWVIHLNGSYHAHEWVMLQKWVSHVWHLNVSYHTRECVISHPWRSHVIYACVMSHI